MDEMETILEQLAEATNLDGQNPDRKREIAVFKELAGTEGLSQYLKDTMAKDMKRYFMAESDTERAHIKGAYLRTAHFAALLTTAVKRLNQSS